MNRVCAWTEDASMFVEIGGQIIGAEHIVRIIALHPDERGRARVRVVVRSGDAIVACGTIDGMKRLCGTTVPAGSGYRVVQAYGPAAAGEAVMFDEYDVIAFRVSDDLDWPVMPVTMAGEPTQAFALVTPNGKCRSIDDEYESVEAFKVAMSKQLSKASPRETCIP